jgi:anti-sigma regulatory factor (Ser/Thr protein kinase)
MWPAHPPIGPTTISLRPVLESAAGARRLIDDLLPGKALRDVRARTRLLTTELVANSVLHANLGPFDTITLEVDLSDALVHVEVRDQGRGLRPRIATSRDSDPSHGLGLVEVMSDRWGLSGRRPTRVWFEIGLPA